MGKLPLELLPQHLSSLKLNAQIVATKFREPEKGKARRDPGRIPAKSAFPACSLKLLKLRPTGIDKAKWKVWEWEKKPGARRLGIEHVADLFWCTCQRPNMRK